jgi:chromate transporter
MEQRPDFKEALKFWIKLGFISFGGPAGHIAFLHKFVVEEKRWISNSKFLHALNYCMLLPGPEAMQLCTYIGWLMYGRAGGLIAGICFVLPSMFILLALSLIYVSYGSLPWIYAMFNGLKPAVIAIVALALFKIGKQSLLSYFHYVLAAAAFVMIYFLHVPFPIIMISAIGVAVVSRKFLPGLMETRAGAGISQTEDESAYYINKDKVFDDIGFKWTRVLRQISVALVLGGIPFLLFYFFTADFAFWKTLSLFFTKAAFVTFGGAYAVLPYVAQVSVEKLQWLSSLEMIDGLSLGETTPGPLVMVLAFVGFMAGYNHFGHSLLMGSIGLVTATFYTFLPCFLFVLVGAPIIEKTKDNVWVKEVLGLTTAAVVGVVLNLTIYLGKAVLLPESEGGRQMDYVALAWIFVSILALYRIKINMISWIGVSALFGLVLYHIG